jgi:hypothetical protein
MDVHGRALQAPPELSGYLLKLGDKGLTRRWSQRWFQQKGKTIYYYKERPKAVGTSRGNTDIVEIHSVRPLPLSTATAMVTEAHNRAGAARRPWTWTRRTSSRRATSTSSRSRWYAAFLY